jgi:deoxycytidylate deaminase
MKRKECSVYHKAQQKALNNGRLYHVAAILRRNNRVVRIGINSSKTHPKYKRLYPDGTWGSHMHAEMDVLRFAQPGDDLEVMRFKKSGDGVTMAKPCRHCQDFIRQSQIRKVRFTNASGQWEELEMKNESR